MILLNTECNESFIIILGTSNQNVCNEDQVIEELRSFSSNGPTDLSPMEFEQPDDLQQSVTRPSDLSLGNMNERTSINTNPEV